MAMNSDDTRAAQLFLAHHDFVKGLALRHAPWPGLMDDIVQQVFLEFLGNQEKWDLESDVRPLLATITRNIALRLWRERTRQQPDVVQKLAEHIRQLADQRDTPPRFEEETGALRSCLDKLPEKSRELVQLYYYDDVGTPDIAERVAMNADTVRRAMSRLRTKLRECIQTTLGTGEHSHA